MPGIEITDECQDHNYFSLVPNIIYSIGLNSNQIAIYCAIKMVTGEKRDCIMSMKKLAAHAGMSLSTFIRWCPTLSEVNKVLKKPLIIISQRIHENGDQDTNSLKIVDIWKENINFCSEKSGGHVNLTPPHVNLTRGHVNLKPGVMSNCQGGHVNLTYKQEQSNKKEMNNNNPPSGSERKGMEEDGKFKKSLAAFLKDMKKHKLPFSDAGVLEAMRESSPYAVQCVIKEFIEREESAKTLKVPDRWLRSKAIKQHEMNLLKQDYE